LLRLTPRKRRRTRRSIEREQGMADNNMELSMFARVANWVAIAAAAIALLLLALLNVVLMFAVWAISSRALAVGIWRRKRRALFRVGLLFLFLAGLSEVLASAFDVNQPLRGLADVLSLGLPIAAMFMADGPRTRGCHRVHRTSEQARMDKRRLFRAISACSRRGKARARSGCFCPRTAINF